MKTMGNEIKKQNGGGSLFSLFGFNRGGAVAKGQPVLVGERGAEMFIPNQTGQITQSARGTSGRSSKCKFCNNNIRCNRISRYVSRK